MSPTPGPLYDVPAPAMPQRDRLEPPHPVVLQANRRGGAEALMVTTLTSPESVGLSPERLARIEPVMQSFVDEQGFSGISVAVARHGQVAYTGQVGYRDSEAAAPMTPDTIFRLYSMTKPVIATALMTLFEEGRFLLIEPVAKYIPAFAGVKVLGPSGALEEPARPIQVRDLLTHTAGLTYDFLETSPVNDLYREARLINDASRPLEAMVAELARLPLAFHPGARWEYSLGLDVAAHLIQVIADRPVGDVLRERLFEPLGMVDTGYGVPASKRDRLAAMYGHPDLCSADLRFSALIEAWMSGDVGRRDVDATYPADNPTVFMRGGHGLFSTTGDYLRFAMMLANGGVLDRTRVIGRKTLSLMYSNHLPPQLLPYAIGAVPNPGYGFGLGSRVVMDVAATGGPGSVGEHGWSGAAKTQFWVDPVEDLAVVFMTQFMVGFSLPEQSLRSLVYQAIVD